MVSSPYRNGTEDGQEGFPLTPRSSTDSLPRQSPPLPSHPTASKLIRLDSGRDSDDQDDLRPRLTLFDASWSEEPDTNPDNDDLDSIDRKRERRRRNRRIYGGGRHRHGDGGSDRDEEDDEDDGGGGNQDLSVGEVAGLIVAGTLSPLPLLVPYACFTLTPALFVPLLALSGVLAWSSAVALGIQGRYVGARSYPGLASAVFPHRFKLHLVGEFLASSFILGGSIVRTTLGVVAASEVVVDLVVPERRRRDWERTVAVGAISLIWLVVPLILPPLLQVLGLSNLTSLNPVHHHYSRLASHSSPSLHHLPLPLSSTTSPNLGSTGVSRRRPHWTALLLLPAYSLTFASWPLALLILGIRLKRLNQDQFTIPSSPTSSSATLLLSQLSVPAFFSPTDPESGLSLWPSILLTLSALSSTSHESFYYITSLVRPDSTTRNKLAFGANPMSRRGSAFIDFDDTAANGDGINGDAHDGVTTIGGGSNSGSAGGGAEGGKLKIGKRNTFPLAMGIGIFIAFLLQLGWALVGTLGFASIRNERGEEVLLGPSGNLLSDPRLPRGDWWLACVRVLVLVGILGQLEGHARVGIKRVRRGVKYFFPSSSVSTSTSARSEEDASSQPPSPLSTSPPLPPTKSERFRSPLARSLVFFIVSILSLTIVSLPAPHRERLPEAGAGRGKREVGGHGIGLVYLAEWAGVGLSGLGCCLIPALTYLVLFHLLPPRSILTTSSTTDPLLLAKERQIQRKLGGRRLWTDIAVFGILGPVGVVVVVRGVWALI